MTHFVVIGDATLDVTVAPSRPLRAAGDVSAVIRVGPGGQGANVAVRLARRGARVTLAAPVAGDAGGRLIGEALTDEGIELMALPASRSATVVALLDADGERSMLSDRQALAADAVGPSLGDAEWIHVSAYALLDDQQGDGLAAMLGNRSGHPRLSVAGGSIPPDPATVARFRARLAVARPDLLLVNRDEAAALLGVPLLTARASAEGLADVAPLVVVTAGGQGSAAILRGSVRELTPPEVAGPVIDATGAGDAYLAALVMALAGTPWPPDEAVLLSAMRAGSTAGAQVARVLGAQARIDGEPAASRKPLAPGA